MKVQIYARKSVVTGKGDSIENQITACKEFIKAKRIDVKDKDIYVYSDM